MDQPSRGWLEVFCAEVKERGLAYGLEKKIKARGARRFIKDWTDGKVHVDQTMMNVLTIQSTQ